MPKYGAKSNGFNMNPYLEEERRGIFSHAKSAWWDAQKYYSIHGAIGSEGFKALGEGAGYKWKGVFGLKTLARKTIKGEGKWATRVRGLLSGDTFMRDFGVSIKGAPKAKIRRSTLQFFKSTTGKGLPHQYVKDAYREAYEGILEAIPTRMKESTGGLFKTAKEALGLGKDKTFIEGLKTGKAGKRTAASILRKSRGIQLASKLGRGLTGFMWLSMMYDVTSTLTQAAVQGVGGIANWAEAKASRYSNNTMELGGNLSPGFFSGQTATERRRALESIRGGYGGRGFLGQEARMMHS